MLTERFLDASPVWLIYAGTILLLFAGSELGFRAGAWHAARRPPSDRTPANAIMGSTLGLLAFTQLVKLTEKARVGTYAVAGLLTLIGIFAMRWNVVIGGQLFSKSFLGYTTYKMAFATREGLLPAILLMILPFVILWVLVKLLPPWGEEKGAAEPAARN